jgi:flagellar biosynthesis/type III secretory pathway protein FliH
MLSSKIFRDGHTTKSIKPFLVQEAALAALYQSNWHLTSSKVIRDASAVPVQAFPLFETSSESTNTDNLTPSGQENEAGLDLSASWCEAQPSISPVAPSHGAVDVEHASSPEPTAAEARLQQAREEAERILAAAQNKATALEAEAYELGLRQGKDAARQDVQQQFASILASFQQATEEIVNLRHEVLRQAEEDVVTLALQLARKIIHREAQSSRDVLAAILRRALPYVVESEEVVVHVNPADLEQTQDLPQDLMHSLRTIRHVTIKGDETIGRGGCVVESAFGEIDARIETQFEELEQRFREQYSPLAEAMTS